MFPGFFLPQLNDFAHDGLHGGVAAFAGVALLSHSLFLKTELALALVRGVFSSSPFVAVRFCFKTLQEGNRAREQPSRMRSAGVRPPQARKIEMAPRLVPSLYGEGISTLRISTAHVSDV